LKQKQIEWKETVKEKKKTDQGLFSPGWLYQSGLEVVTHGLGLAPFSPGWYNPPKLKSPNQSRLEAQD
jgi:hypothetical protein